MATRSLLPLPPPPPRAVVWCFGPWLSRAGSNGIVSCVPLSRRLRVGSSLCPPPRPPPRHSFIHAQSSHRGCNSGHRWGNCFSLDTSTLDEACTARINTTSLPALCRTAKTRAPSPENKGQAARGQAARLPSFPPSDNAAPRNISTAVQSGRRSKYVEGSSCSSEGMVRSAPSQGVKSGPSNASTAVQSGRRSKYVKGSSRSCEWIARSTLGKGQVASPNGWSVPFRAKPGQGRLSSTLDFRACCHPRVFSVKGVYIRKW